MVTKVTKHIGLQTAMPAGITRDFDYLNAFDNWITAQNLVTQDIWVEALVYSNHTDADMANTVMNPIGYDETRYCLVRPAPGKSWVELNPIGTAVDYYSTGVELTMRATPTPRLIVGNGVLVEGFRIKVLDPIAATTAGQAGVELARVTNSSSYPNTVPGQLRRCLISSEITNAGNAAVRQGAAVTPNETQDCVFFQSVGAGVSIRMSGSSNVRRVTHIKRGTATGSAIDNTSCLESIITDQVMVNCGNVPIVMIASANAAKITKNYTNTALTTSHSGITYTESTVVSTTDARPAVGSPIINGASASAIGTFDVTNKARGGAPDAGAVQLNIPAPPPTGAKTFQTLNGQTLSVDFSIAGTALSATSTLTAHPTTPNGAVDQAAVEPTVGVNSGSVVYENIDPPGNYVLTVTLTNLSGSTTVTGIDPVVILGLDGGGDIPPGGVEIPPDTEKPVMVGNVMANNITTYSFDVSWDAAQDALGVVSYSISLNGGVFLNKGLTRTHSFTGLTESSVYSVAVIALDAAGNIADPIVTSVTTAPDAVNATINLVGANGEPASSLTNLKWAWFDQVTPDLFSAPTDKGSVELTDAEGNITVYLVNTLKTSGQIGWLIVTNSNGTTGMIHKAFSGPVAIN